MALLSLEPRWITTSSTDPNLRDKVNKLLTKVFQPTPLRPKSSSISKRRLPLVDPEESPLLVESSRSLMTTGIKLWTRTSSPRLCMTSVWNSIRAK